MLVGGSTMQSGMEHEGDARGLFAPARGVTANIVQFASLTSVHDLVEVGFEPLGSFRG
jgi:hypothetical protein